MYAPDRGSKRRGGRICRCYCLGMDGFGFVGLPVCLRRVVGRHTQPPHHVLSKPTQLILLEFTGCINDEFFCRTGQRATAASTCWEGQRVIVIRIVLLVAVPSTNRHGLVRLLRTLCGKRARAVIALTTLCARSGMAVYIREQKRAERVCIWSSRGSTQSSTDNEAIGDLAATFTAAREQRTFAWSAIAQPSYKISIFLVDTSSTISTLDSSKLLGLLNKKQGLPPAPSGRYSCWCHCPSRMQFPQTDTQMLDPNKSKI